MALAWRVARKDLLIEWRSRVLLWQVVPFGAMALLLAGLALGPTRAGSSGAGPGLFYLVMVLVTLLAAQRSAQLERTSGTRASIATLGLDPAGVFLGKALALALELWAIGLVLAGGTVLFLHTPLRAALVSAPATAAALAALAAAGTLYGALSAGEGAGATLLPVLALPGFSPLLIAGERSFSQAATGEAPGAWWVITLVALVVYLAAGVVLYGVLEDS